MLSPLSAIDDLPRERRRPLLRAEYDQLVEIGAFENEKIELLAGMLVRMSPQGVPHAYVVTRLMRLLSRILDGRAEVFSQVPLALSADSEPEPDVYVAPPGEYSRHRPNRALLVVEVANSSVVEDRKVKGPLYAAAGVPEFWLVDLTAEVVEVYRQPKEGEWLVMEKRGREETLSLAEFPDVALRVEDFLPPR